MFRMQQQAERWGAELFQEDVEFLDASSHHHCFWLFLLTHLSLLFGGMYGFCNTLFMEVKTEEVAELQTKEVATSCETKITA
jgi:hypothetical protein